MNIEQVMSSHVDRIAADASIFDAAKQMTAKEVGCLVVIGNQRVSGIITDRDLVTRCMSKGHTPAQCRVADHMSKPAVVAEGSADLVEVAHLMSQHKVTRVPIVENGELIGIVSLSDIALATDMVKKSLDDTVHDLLMGMGGRRSTE
jgi:CBS domain-containing protein